MNKWNKAIMSIMTIVTLLVSMAGLFAMKPKAEIKPYIEQEEYYFTGTVASQQSDPAYYQKVDATHPAPSDCLGGTVNCLILANPNTNPGMEGKPDLTPGSFTVLGSKSL